MGPDLFVMTEKGCQGFRKYVLTYLVGGDAQLLFQIVRTK